MITWPLPKYRGGSAKGCQTSQYSLCISVTQFSFYMVNSTFYTVNFLLFIWSTWVLCGPLFTFNNINFYSSYGQLNFLFFVWSSCLYLVKSTFYMVNFLLLISVREKHRLQTGSEVQTECKMQTEDCRPDQG